MNLGSGGQSTPPFKCLKHVHKWKVLFVCLFALSLKLLKFHRTLESQIPIRRCTEVDIGKHLSGMFVIQKNGANKGDVILPLLFSFASEYTIRVAQEKQVRLKLDTLASGLC